MASPKRRQREIEHAREDILQAAARAFRQSGYTHATMQDIAREAGYTAASLYTYFSSKEEIVEALIDSVTNEYAHTLDEPFASGLTFRQRFEMLLRRQLEVASQQRPMFSGLLMMGQNGGAVQQCVARCVHDNFTKRIGHLRDWLKKNAEPEEIGNHDPELVAQYLYGAVYGLIHAWMLNGSSQQQLVNLVPFILNLVFHGIGGPATHSRKHTQ